MVFSSSSRVLRRTGNNEIGNPPAAGSEEVLKNNEANQ